MARPQSPDYDKRRETILAAAARLYAKRGFTGTSVSDLATACNTSKSLIYHYFPSKDDTLYSVMETHLDALVDAAQASGFHAVFARIVGGHEASIRLHTALGFDVVGTEREVGRKFGKWLDVVVMERLLR